jgi:hypothetical protein
MLYIYIYICQTLLFIVTESIFLQEQHLCVVCSHHSLTMSMSKGLMAFGVLMLLMTTFVAGDVADTITRKPKYLSYEGLPRCDPEKNPQCLHRVAPGRGCKAEDRCREG